MNNAVLTTSKKSNQKCYEIGIFKLYGVNQYVLRANGQDINFLLKEDAQRFAKHIMGVDRELVVYESPALI